MLGGSIESKLFFALGLKVAFTICSLYCSEANAFQGRLGGIRSQVRDQAPAPSSENRSSTQSSHDDRSSGGGALRQAVNKVRADETESAAAPQRRPNRRNRRRNRNGNFFFYHHQPHVFHPLPVCNDWVYEEHYLAPVVHDEFYEPEGVILSAPEQPPVYHSTVEEVDLVSPVYAEHGSDFSAWAIRGSATIGGNFDDLTQGGLQLLFQEPGGLGLDLSVTTLREQGANFRDHLWLGDVNILFESINTNYFRARVGAGVTWLADSIDGEAGFNLTVAFDWQIADRWVLSGEGDIGTLGDADFWHGRLNLARQIGQAEWLVGIDHYDIGGANFHTVFTGLGFRF